MTGEVTLRGRVLPIGGLKEKLLAALRGGITTVLIPAENEKDLAEIPASVKDALEIVPVGHVDEVLARALSRAAGRRSNGPRPTSMATEPVVHPPTGGGDWPAGSSLKALTSLANSCLNERTCRGRESRGAIREH